MKVLHSMFNNNPTFSDEELQDLEDLLMFVLYEHETNYEDSMYSLGEKREEAYRNILNKIKMHGIFDYNGGEE